MSSSRSSLDLSLPIETLMKNIDDIGSSISDPHVTEIDRKTVAVIRKEHENLLADDEFWLEKIRTYYPREYALMYDDNTLEYKRRDKWGPLSKFDSNYECFKWCFEDDFCTIKEKRDRGRKYFRKYSYEWLIYRTYYLRLKEHNLDALKEWREKHLNYFYDNKNKREISFARKVDGRTPLYIVCEDGRLDIVKWLVEENHVDVEVGALNTEAWHLGPLPTINPLFVACKKNYVNIVKFLLENKAKVSAKWYSKGSSQSALFASAEKGNTEIVKLLLEQGAYVEDGYDINGGYGNSDNLTPLYTACKGGHVGVVKLLLEHGADVKRGRCSKRNNKNSFTTPLQKAESLKSSSVKNEMIVLLNQYIHKQKIETDLQTILEKKDNKDPLSNAITLFTWYGEQGFLSKHFFHYKNIAKLITQELMKLKAEYFNVNAFNTVITNAFTKQAIIDQSSFIFWKKSANHTLLKADGHFKTIEDIIKRQLPKQQPILDTKNSM